MTDPSNGYEGIAAEYLSGRGRAPSTAVGVKATRYWAQKLPPGATVLDLGCGSGLPITKALVDEGLNVYAVDAAPSFVEAFRRNLPGVPVACESAVDSSFFNRTFDGVVAWGLIFLLRPEEQRHLIRRVADVIVPGGRLLFTSGTGTEPIVWNDAQTGLESRTLGAVAYRKLLAEADLWVTEEYEDEGESHYYDAVKGASAERR